MNPEEYSELKEAPIGSNGVSLDANDVSASANSPFMGEASQLRSTPHIKRRVLLTVAVPVAIALAIICLLLLLSILAPNNTPDTVSDSQQPFNELDTSKLPFAPLSVDVTEVKSVTFSKTITAGGSFVVAPSLQPTESVTGQIYYDREDNEVRVYTGDSYATLLTKQANQQVCYVGSDCGFATVADIPVIPPFPTIPDFPEQITLPQDLAVIATPTFRNVNLTDRKAHV